jgi:hypothetical protein
VAKITNLHGLPEALVRAVENDPYDSQGADISVTKLIDAPQRVTLRLKHEDDIVVDVSDMIWSLEGQGIHHVLERAAMPGALIEHRFFADVLGWKLSGQADWLHPESKTLIDYKHTGTYNMGQKPEWERQLNVLRWLALQNDIEVERLFICAFYRDWSKMGTLRGGDYPPAKGQMYPIRVWPMAETRAYIESRIRMHQQARIGQPVLCTEDERWASAPKWALMQLGKKRAVRLYDADPKATLGRLPEDQYVEYRPGESRRCQHYCEVARWCPQWAATHHDPANHDETDQHPEA